MLIQDQIYQTALRFGVDPSIAISVAQKESNFNQAARGSAGEIGIFQLKPSTANEVGKNPFDTQGNIEGGVLYLKKQFDRFGNWWVALAAYNGGARNVERGTVSNAAQTYADSVLSASGVSTSNNQSLDYINDFPIEEEGIGIVAVGVAIAAGIGLYLAFRS
jgi:soluble lytic murein transglycosylase-like protein